MPTKPPFPAARVRLPWLWLALIGLVWAWYCHFWPYLHTANESMRLYFVQAVAESGRPELDAIVKRHGSVPVDRSEHGGHIYMDKAPGLSALALPFYTAARAIDPRIQDTGLWRFGYLATLLTVALPLVGMLILLVTQMHPLGTPQSLRLTVVALATASPLLVYASLYFGHGLATACVGGAFYALLGGDPHRLSRRRAWLVGISLGYAGFTDTPVFVLAALIGLHSWARAFREGELTLHAGWASLRQVWPIAAGIALGVAAQLAYNTWVLGSPWSFTYQFKGDRQLAAIMDSGLLGFRTPQADALVGLWLSPRRGLLYHAPWLAAAIAGLWWLASRGGQERQHRMDAAGALAISGSYALFVSGFSDWPGGDCVGARHLLPIVPLLGWGLMPLWSAALPPLLRGGVVASLLAGAVMHLPTTITFPYHFESIQRPLLELAVPLLTVGAVSPSLGEWLGLDGAASALLFTAMVGTLWLWPWWAGGPDEPRVAWPWKQSMALVTVLVVWAVGVTAGVPARPGRAAEVGRFRASQLLKSGSGSARSRP